jgi:hypothetical protein
MFFGGPVFGRTPFGAYTLYLSYVYGELFDQATSNEEIDASFGAGSSVEDDVRSGESISGKVLAYATVVGAANSGESLTAISVRRGSLAELSQSGEVIDSRVTSRGSSLIDYTALARSG